MEQYQTWRKRLAALIERPRERTRLALVLGISVSTLQRWTTGEASPLPHQRDLLLQALPEHQMLPGTLLAEEFDDLPALPGLPAEGISVAFSALIFDLHASASEESRYWSICTAILSEAVKQLDPRRLGISLRVVQAMTSPRTESVRYLRACASLGTPPWPEQIEFHTGFLGAESLAGHAVTLGLPQTVADSRQKLYPASYLPEHAASAAAFPILHTGRVAGCLLAASTQAGYFAEPARLELLQGYSALLVLAFAPEQFYPFEQIALQTMPDPQVQLPYLSNFQQRVLATLKTAFTVNRSLSYPEAQQFVWSQIAEELLHLPIM
ncbi:MAG TPA: GAF domain-containing protein [Ktedonobacteraceae bacterium]